MIYEWITDESELCRQVAEILADGQVVGWFQGRMEFGPRSLGARSLLGDPRQPNMQSLMNQKIKFRESFRPFAPVVLRDRVAEFFEWNEGVDSPYMLLVTDVHENQRIADTDEATATGLARINLARSTIPAVTHVDGSARVQTVDARRHGRFHRLLKAFEQATGCPVLINTSFNVRGEPVVCRPEEAIRCFLATDIDVLVLECGLVRKADQSADDVGARQRYLKEFVLD
ncbi:MAG: hypothetical protein B7Z55_19035 [Planctomycetales bacterium 12-60-4]|nr:MAG: hypothetical protein B7Z55_19035 [Planctomycetales bacterium 12-60-4]